jgi:hypothetical protein
MRDPFEDWWLEEQHDGVSVFEDEPPRTVEQYFDRFEPDHVFQLEDLTALRTGLNAVVGRDPASRSLAKAVRDEMLRRCDNDADATYGDLARAAGLSEATVRRITRETERPRPRLLRDR